MGYPDGPIQSPSYWPNPKANAPTVNVNTTMKCSTAIRVKLDSEGSVSDYRVKSECFRVPLKSGGFMSLAWNFTPYMAPYFLSVMESDIPLYGSGWLPAGRGGYFSFFPYLTVSSKYYPDQYHRLCEEGLLRYLLDSTEDPYQNYKSYNRSFYNARYSSITTYFQEYDDQTQSYYVYGAIGHPLCGRPIESTDRNGNNLYYHYSDNGQGKPLLRKMTGDFDGITPYFGYDNETYPALITKIELHDEENPEKSRSVYFRYDNVQDVQHAFLNQIVYPSGCVKSYELSPTAYTDVHHKIEKEEDALGYISSYYYDYSERKLIKTEEPEGRIAEYDYRSAPYETYMTYKGRAPKQYRYELYTGVPLISFEKGPMGNTTYYEWQEDLLSKKIEANGKVTYYEYNSLGNQTKQTEDENIVTEYIYASGDETAVIAEKNPRGYTTYYEYDSKHNKVAQIDRLGGRAETGRNSQGNIIRRTNERGCTTYYNYKADTDLLETMIDAEDKVTYYSYNAWHEKTSETSPRWEEIGIEDFTTYFEYDKSSRMTSSLDPLGNAAYYEYDSRGDMAAKTNARGIVTEYEYNGLRLKTKEEVKENEISQQKYEYGYDPYKNRIWEKSPRGYATYFIYDDEDQLIKTIDALGNTTYYGYDSVGNRTSQVDATGKSSYFQYDRMRHLTCQTDALGHRVYFEYDAAGNRIQEIDALNNASYFTYDALDRRTCTTDALGNSTYFSYDAVGNTMSQTDALGHSLYFTYDAMDRRTCTTDALGNPTYFAYDAADNITSGVDAQGHASYFIYDALNRRICTTDALGNSTYFAYDVVGNTTAQTDALGHSLYFSYDALNHRTCSQDALGNPIYFSYDAAGNTTSQTDALGYSTYFTYDALDRQASATDPLCRQTKFEYDALSRRTCTLNPLNHRSEVRYDAAGNAIAQSNCVGHTVYFLYDEKSQTTAIINPLGFSTYFEYDSVGNKISELDALENSTYFYYNKNRQLKGVINALGNETYFSYDANQNQTAQVNPLGNVSYYYYDALNRIYAIQDPIHAMSYFAYDAAGNQSLVQDAMSNTTYYTYDALRRQTGMTNALAQTESYTYDANSNLTGTTDPDANTTYYTYDVLNRQTQILYPDDSFHYYEYNAASELAAARDERGYSYFTYNCLSKLIKETLPDGDEVAYSYDVAEQKTIVKTSQATWRYRYDAQGNMLTIERRQSPTSGYGLQPYGTSPYGGTKSMTGYGKQPFGSSPYGEGYKSLPGSVYYEYDPINKLTKKTLGNGCYTYFNYDEANRINQILSCKNDGEPLAYFEYTYDAASRITECARENGTVIYYGYDAASRLTSEICQGAELSSSYHLQWEYDAAGNRIYQNYSGEEETYYTYDAGNALIQKHISNLGYTYYSYDSRGNCTLIQDTEENIYFEYNHANLVTLIHYISEGNDPVWNYFHYDSQLRRYALQDSSGLAYFTWDSNGLNLLAEEDSEGNTIASYVHGYTPIEGIGSLVAAKKEVNGCTYYQYPIYDHRGTVVKLLDENSETVGKYQYNAWGVPLQEQESGAGNRFGWQSNWIRLRDYGEGLLLSPTRIYSAKDGRFLQRDMLGFVDGLNLYQPFSSNPNTSIDPKGMFDPFVFTEEQEKRRREKEREGIKKAIKKLMQVNPYVQIDSDIVEKAINSVGILSKYDLLYWFIITNSEDFYNTSFDVVYIGSLSQANSKEMRLLFGNEALNSAITVLEEILHAAINHATIDGKLQENYSTDEQHMILQSYMNALIDASISLKDAFEKLEVYEQCFSKEDLEALQRKIAAVRDSIEIVERMEKNFNIKLKKLITVLGIKNSLKNTFEKKLKKYLYLK